MSTFPLEIWHVIFRHLVPVYPVCPRLHQAQDGSCSIILQCDPREDPDIAQNLQYFLGNTFRPNKLDPAHSKGLLGVADYKRVLATIDREELEGFLFPGS